MRKNNSLNNDNHMQHYIDESKLDYFNDFNFELWSIFNQAGDVLTKARERELNQFDLTKAQAEILHKLMSNDKGTTIQEISMWNAKELSSISTLINRMEKNDLVKKSRSGTKKTLIFITEKGRDLYTNIPRRSIDMIFSALSEDEKQQLKSSMHRLRDKGRELLGIDFKPPFLLK